MTRFIVHSSGSVGSHDSINLSNDKLFTLLPPEDFLESEKLPGPFSFLYKVLVTLVGVSAVVAEMWSSMVQLKDFSVAGVASYNWEVLLGATIVYWFLISL